jgi:hypothetical protein
MPPDVAIPDQIHTVRHQFGPVAIERDAIIALAEDIQKELPRSRVIVNFDTGTEQSRYLQDFKALQFASERATSLKLHSAEPDPSGIQRLITIEFGQILNVAMAQGASRSWTLGAVDNIRRQMIGFERAYANKQYGSLITQLIVLATIVFLPSLDTLTQRAILMVCAVAVTIAITKMHGTLLPNAAIYLGKRNEGALNRIFQSVGMWLMGLIGSIIVALVGAYLKGYFHL